MQGIWSVALLPKAPSESSEYQLSDFRGRAKAVFPSLSIDP
jgi:hypothetical protein